ncbi:MAG: M48 family metalloprotease [Granulosicoccus sp.]
MDFFAQQDTTRRTSALLLLVFFLALGAMAVVVHLTIAVLSMVLGETENLWQSSVPAMAMTGLIWLTMLLGGFFRALDVRAGGAVLARRYGAVQASDRTRHEHEQILLNVVAEVSIAASYPQPDVFVLRNESSINAFVVGSTDANIALVVSQGALDLLDRDELQAVVAHEFGHIAQGDLPMNMRLLIALGGLNALDEVGQVLVGKHPDDNAHPGVLVGYLLRGLGSAGVFFGSLIRAAFSRQREFLADASAAQFTRNPYALASALAVIRDRQEQSALHSPHAQELAHLCFHVGSLVPWYRRLLASHPRLQLRIDAIDPHFAVKKRTRRRTLKDSTTVDGVNNKTAGNNPKWTGVGSPQLAVVGGTDLAVDARMDINGSGLSDRIVLLLPDESSCLAVLFALFASTDPIKRQAFLDAVSFSYNPEFSEQVKGMLARMPGELQEDQLGIIQHATVLLSEKLMLESRQRVMMKLEKLLPLTGDYNLVNYATLQLIRRKLAVEFPIIDSLTDTKLVSAEQRRVKTFDAMGQEFALLLSLMVESSGSPSETMNQDFERVLKCYTQTPHSRRTGNEPGIVEELEAAFQTLYVQPKTIRHAFVQHCIEIVQHDGKLVPAERALLDLFAASLGCEELAAAA